jgi:hypothetical protein
MFVTALYKVFVIWTFCCTGKKSIYESLPVVLMNIRSSILREVSACPRGSKTIFFRLAKFLLEALCT